MYYWNSKGTRGNSVDFMQEFYGMPFLEAVQELANEKGRQVVTHVAIPPVPKILVMPDKADNVRRVYAYLVQTRKISKAVVQLCFDRHLIYQDTFGNVVFRMKDIDGNIIGAEIRGTSQQVPFKKIESGSKYGNGFNISLGANCERMIVFESSIDLLSFITLYRDKLHSRLLVSMAGLKQETLLNMAKIHDIALHNVCCCVDNDEAGIKFAGEMQVKYGTKTFLPVGVKDWNEALQGREIN